ncbi:group 1 truncated hemoglobin [Haloferula helveola]
METESLFTRVGGEAGIEKLVDAFYGRVTSDALLAPFFEKVPMEHLTKMQKEFFSEALGGPLFYTGRSMRQVHAGRGIRKEHLQRFTEILLETLEAERDDLDLTPKDVNDIYSRIAIEADRITDDVAESG